MLLSHWCPGGAGEPEEQERPTCPRDRDDLSLQGKTGRSDRVPVAKSDVAAVAKKEITGCAGDRQIRIWVDVEPSS